MQQTKTKQTQSPFAAFGQLNQTVAQPSANQSGSPSWQALNMQGYGTPSFTSNTTQRVISPFGNFDNLQQYNQHQDAFVQQFLQNQAQYNSGQLAGQNTQRVPVMESWKQAGDNIASGQYQGNPLATGNMAGLANLFSQYGMTMQPGFQDQLMQLIGQQSAPSLYSPPPPSPPLAGGDQRQQWRDAGMPGYDPSQGAWQVITDGWANPNQSAAYQNWLGSQGQPSDMRGGPGGPLQYGGPVVQPQPAPPTPGYGGAIGVPVDQRRFNDIIDRDSDGVDDRFQPGPGQPNPEWSQPGGHLYAGVPARTMAMIPSEMGRPPQQPPTLMTRAVPENGRPPQQPPMYQTMAVPENGRPPQQPPSWPGMGQQPPSPSFAPPGAARPIPPSGQGTPYEPPPPLRAQPGTSGPGWRESEGVRIYDPYTDPRGTGPVGAVGPNHLRPGVILNPITGQEQYDPFTDPIGTGGGPATPHNAPIGNTWGTGRPVPPPLRRDPILDPRPTVRPPPMRRNPRNDLYLG